MSFNPHFFKAYTRLGLINAPVYSDQLNIGVEDAPNFILSEQFLRQFMGCRVSEYKFPNPEDIKKENYWQTLALHLEGVSSKINKDLKPGEIQVMIGGDNSVTFSSILAVQERLKDPLRLGYIQFDSHGESNNFSTSSSGNFHGMYMRPFFSDDFEVEEINGLVRYKIPIDNVICFGNLDLDGDEPKLFKEKKIRTIKLEEVLKDRKKIEEELRECINQLEHVHINFDIDVMDKTVAGATGIPTEKGFFPQDIFPFLEILKNHPSWSLDLVEVNPKKDGSEKTVAFAQEVIKFLLER